MKYISAISTSTDPYRAGTEIGEALKAVSPEVVILFSSVTYKGGYSELYDGLSDCLDNPNVIVFGGTGDGVYEMSQAANYAVSALGINSEGTMRWTAAVEDGTKSNSREAAKRCTTRALGELGVPPTFCMVLADGTTADGAAIVQGVRDLVELPVFGGLAADDRKFFESRVYLNGRDYADAVIVLLGHGTMPYAIHSASGWQPLGELGLVEEVEGTVIQRVSGKGARDFMSDQIGKPFGGIDVGVISLAAYQEGAEHPFFLRSTSRLEADGNVSVFGSIAKGTHVRVCTATREEVLQGVAEVTAELTRGDLGFLPRAGVVVSCAARKWLLEDRGDRELKTLFDTLGVRLPLAGFPSFGEIGPFRTPSGYTDTYFHNVTFVLCLFGE